MTLTLNPNFQLTTEQAELIQKTIAYESASLSPNTLRSYKSMWLKFSTWCKRYGLSDLPASAETIAIYISSLGESFSFSILDSTLAAIEYYHEKANMTIKGDASLYRRVRKGIRRTHKENQSTKQAPAISVLDLKGACCKLKDSLRDRRDRALLTLCFFGAFRRSEVVSLDLANCEFTDKGATIMLLQSKTSDKAKAIYISYAKDQDICPVRALEAWIDTSQIKEGAIFRAVLKGGKVSERLSGHGVSAIIKRHFGERYSGHSTRRGLITASAEKGVPMHIIKKHSRHKSSDMVMRYIEDTKGFEESSVMMLGV